MWKVVCFVLEIIVIEIVVVEIIFVFCGIFLWYEFFG